jgi:uncharacterized membrane protein YecN with MAPEG domain
MTLVHSPLYAALLGFILLALSARVIVYRRSHKISLGDTGDKALLKRMRAQSNFVEYAPMGLILLVLVELTGAPAIAVHVLGLMLVAGRAMHGYGFSSTPQVMQMRVGGMILTLISILLCAVGLLLHWLF